jgi:hypothetical protein
MTCRAVLFAVLATSVSVTGVAGLRAEDPPVANTVVQSTVSLISGAFGLTAVPDTAVIAGRVSDCDNESLFGAVLRLFRSDGTEIVGGSVAYRYFNGSEFPAAGRRVTNTDGLFLAANVPGTDGEVLFAEVWGRRNDASQPEILGCETVPIHAGGVSIVDVRGLRTDGPACPSLP